MVEPVNKVKLGEKLLKAATLGNLTQVKDLIAQGAEQNYIGRLIS